MIGVNDELVIAGFGRQYRSFPADGKLSVIKLARHWSDDAEIESDEGIDAAEDSFASLELPRFEVLGLQPAFVVPACRGPEAADEIGHGIAVLAHRQAGKLQPRRLVARLSVF